MRGLILFGTVLAVVIASLVVGVPRFNAAKLSAATLPPAAAQGHEQAQIAPMPASAFAEDKNIPHIGSIQVLNGCGKEGAANRVADFLRSKSFDVKEIGNAATWNHQTTMIISRTADMGLANEIEKFMKTGKVVLIRNGESLYDVTIVAGPDFEERIK